jgi:hypothetical protein
MDTLSPRSQPPSNAEETQPRRRWVLVAAGLAISIAVPYTCSRLFDRGDLPPLTVDLAPEGPAATATPAVPGAPPAAADARAIERSLASDPAAPVTATAPAPPATAAPASTAAAAAPSALSDASTAQAAAPNASASAAPSAQAALPVPPAAPGYYVGAPPGRDVPATRDGPRTRVDIATAPPGAVPAGPSSVSPGPIVAASPLCGDRSCPAGTVCCNASCGICTPPGGTCPQGYCGAPNLPVSVQCGMNTCNVGEVCCNASCGICTRAGESCSQQRCEGLQNPVSVQCGMNTCNVGQVCCNASCGICALPGESCSQQACR